MTKRSKTEPVARESASIPEDQLSCLRACFPEAFTENKVDMEKLRDTLGDIVETSPERYSFTWAGKKDAIRILQTPSRAALIPEKRESVKFEETQNIFIEGDNLEVLKLLYKPYFGRVKMIFIDPPYNTGNDFIYPDNYADPLNAYLQISGQQDANGNLLTSNPDTSGRFHSAWLSMMYPRLFLARQLLREDGVIFITIDDNEVHNLKMVMNEIFGEENFIADIAWEKRYTRSNDAKLMASVIDHILLYRKNGDVAKLREPRTEKSNSIYSNPDNDPRGVWTSVSYVSQRTKAQRPNLCYKVKNQITGEEVEHESNAWKFSKKQYEQHAADKRLYWGATGRHKYPRLKKYLSEMTGGLVPINLWKYQETGTVDDGTKEVDALIGKDVFDYPKPTSLIRRMLQMATDNEAEHVILDFFAGSGTTAHSVMQLNAEDGGNRMCISVQLPEPCEAGSRAAEAGYKNIAELSRDRISKAGKQIATKNKEADCGMKVFKLSTSNYRSWTGTEERDPEALAKQMEAFNDPLMEGWKPENVLYEVAIKEGFGLNIQTEHIENVKGQEVHRVTDPDREQSFYLCLDDKLNIDALAPLKLTQDDLFICRDIALDDTAAANLALQCRLKTI